MSTIAREWAALHRTDRIPLLRTLLSGQVGQLLIIVVYYHRYSVHREAVVLH